MEPAKVEFFSTELACWVGFLWVQTGLGGASEAAAAQAGPPSGLHDNVDASCKWIYIILYI